jgi:hypothetical protein
MRLVLADRVEAERDVLRRAAAVRDDDLLKRRPVRENRYLDGVAPPSRQ